MSFSTPSKAELKNMLGMLFADLEVNSCDSIALDGKDIFFGLYLNDDNEPATLVVCDIRFCAYLGSSMTMLPPPVAEDAIQSGSLEDMMVSNIKEVMNIISRLFMLRGSDHLKFSSFHSASSDLPDSISKLLANIDQEIYFDVGLPRYGSGKLGFLVPPS